MIKQITPVVLCVHFPYVGLCTGFCRGTMLYINFLTLTLTASFLIYAARKLLGWRGPNQKQK
jgi:hypothetical protein